MCFVLLGHWWCAIGTCGVCSHATVPGVRFPSPVSAVIEPRGMIWAAPTGAVSKIHRACGKIHGDACGRKRVPWHLVNKHLTDTLDRVAKLPLPHEGGKHGDTADGTETKSGEYATIVKGYARMLDEHTVGVSACCGLDEPLTHTVTGAVIIVATGSVASHLPGTPFDNKYVFDSDTIKDLGRTPRRLVIQGGGIIGIEYAFIMRQLGAEVLVVEYMPDMLTSLDSTLRKAILARLARCGVRVVLHATVKFVRVPSSDPSSGDVVELLVEPRSAAGEADLPPAAEYCWKGCEPSSPASTISSPLVVRCDAFMAATGRVGNTSTLDLACVGIKTDRYGRIPVQPRSMWSGVENIYAVGDVSGPSVFLPHGLVTTGQAQGIRAVYSAFINEWPSSHLRAEYYDHIPVAMWLSPDVAFVGLTEEDAVERYGRRHVACSIGLYSRSVWGTARVSLWFV